MKNASDPSGMSDNPVAIGDSKGFFEVNPSAACFVTSTSKNNFKEITCSWNNICKSYSNRHTQGLQNLPILATLLRP